MLRILTALLLIAAWSPAQPIDTERFEVASVKANGSDESNIERMGIRADGAQFNCYNMTLKRLLMYAYQVKQYQISGPAWIGSEMYTIAAKLPLGATREQAPVMLQHLLKERFHLELTRQPKEMSIYELTTAKGGFKLSPSSSAGPGGVPASPSSGGQPATSGGGGVARVAPGADGGPPRVVGYHKMNLKRCTLARLANLLELQLDRPVKDVTGIAGEFDFALEYTTADSVQDVANIFAALPQQSGLKLEGKKGPVDVLMIDRADRTPIEN
jgi:uncharacterized protein (TIGR03435 family)